MHAVTRLGRWLGAPRAPDRPPAPGEDWRLWRAAGDGDARAATRLVQQLSPQAYGLAVQLLGRAEDAEDAVQEAFARLWRSTPSDTHGASLATYFNTIVLNRCRSLLTGRREQATEPDDLAALQDAAQAEAGADGFNAGEVAGPDGALARALATLPVRQRMAVVMWAYADASVADIARTLDLDPNAAHQLLHRARQALRARLDPAATRSASPARGRLDPAATPARAAAAAAPLARGVTEPTQEPLP
jgi:RNA polymerase sigma-70 factor (ECF subfamily)